MRLHRLELEGFGPYRDRQSVDFDAFADDGIFLIAGRTGAGKSSILDGVCFALYGGVPRYDSSDRRLRSDHCAPDDVTEVELEFTVAGGRWRVTRAPEYERPKRRGGGMTTEGARAELSEFVDEVWVGRAVGPRDVALSLEEILGLSQQQFLQVILLAQNSFQRFLLAKNDERQRLLRTLFGTRSFEEYEKALDQRRKDADAAVAAGAGQIELLLADIDELVREHGLAGEDEGATAATPTPAARIAAAGTASQRADYRADTAGREREVAERALRTAEEAHAARTALGERQRKRVVSRGALAALESEASAVAADREVLARALEAEALRGPVDAAARAESAVATARERELLARAAIGTAEPEASAAEGDLPQLVERLTAELALAEAAATAEKDLTRNEKESVAATARVATLERAIADIEAGIASVPATRARIAGDLDDATAAASAADPARDRRDDLTRRLAAARDAATLATAVQRADTAHLERSAAFDAAAAAVTDLLRRRLTGYAGELAADLVDGEPCAVCGAVEHPRPAHRGDEPVTDDMIVEAERARDTAAASDRSAAEAARAARTAHADASARAGGDDVETLTVTVADAERALAAATEAGVRRDRLTAERAELDALEASAIAERTSLESEAARARQNVAVAAERVAVGRIEVDAARGDFASVADRVTSLARRRDRVRDLAAGVDDRRRRAAAAAESVADRDERITASAFDDVAATRDALRDEPTRGALDARLRAHDAALSAERERLRELELELAGVGDEPVDVAASALASDEARARWTAATTAAAEIESAAARLRRLIDRAAAAYEGIGELAEERAVLTRLADTVAGRAPNTHRMTLETFVLAAELEEIVEAANLRLHDMSSGRYRLRHTDARAARNASSGLGIEIVDGHTGVARPAQSLSGGETFLASLALALGLAEVVTSRAGGLRLDTLFVDEGFGSLDAETLDIAMATLDELRQGGRTVGVISHVEAMKEQLPAQLVVEATPQGPSIVRQAALVAG